MLYISIYFSFSNKINYSQIIPKENILFFIRSNDSIYYIFYLLFNIYYNSGDI